MERADNWLKTSSQSSNLEASPILSITHSWGVKAGSMFLSLSLLLECMHRKGKGIELPAWLKTELSVGESLLGKEGEWIDGVAGN